MCVFIQPIIIEKHDHHHKQLERSGDFQRKAFHGHPHLHRSRDRRSHGNNHDFSHCQPYLLHHGLRRPKVCNALFAKSKLLRRQKATGAAISTHTHIITPYQQQTLYTYQTRTIRVIEFNANSKYTKQQFHLLSSLSAAPTAPRPSKTCTSYDNNGSGSPVDKDQIKMTL